MPDKPLKYCLHVREDLAALKDGFFDTPEFYGMKSDLYMYRHLRDFLRSKHIDLNTQQVNSLQESNVIFCVNETHFFENYQRTAANRLLVLILTEPPVYNKSDWEESRHRPFDLVFTYNPDLVKKDPNKYIFLAYPIDFSERKTGPFPDQADFEKKRHSCLIAGAFAITRSSDNQDSLLYDRYKVMAWYNKHAPGQLDYFGRTHPEQKFMHFRGASLVSRINPGITKFVAGYAYQKKLAAIYKGAVPGLGKNKTLSGYKFNFCFENTSGLKGYISEKIFDCFFSHTVPVYYGAPDIEQYIPKNCFISFTDFPNIKALQEYLQEMSYATYRQYLENVDNFLNSPAAGMFSIDKFTETLYRATRP